MKKSDTCIQFTSIFLFTLVLLTGCGDDNPASPGPEPTTGALEVTTATIGPDKDADGYSIILNGANGQSADTTGSIVFTGLEAGSYKVELTEAAANCSVDSGNPQSVNITPGDTTSISFDVSCIEVLNNQIVFVSDRDHSNGELYLTNPDGTGQIRLTNNNDGELFPAISPDGTRIAYLQEGNIWVMNADGSNPEQLTAGGDDALPLWSPDGSRIVFTSERDGDNEIYVMDSDGSNQTNLSNHSGFDVAGGWSPDAERIIFHSNRDSDGDMEIYTINTEGTALQQLTYNTTSDLFPSFSPSGDLIAFNSNRDGNNEIYIMGADGVGLRRLTVNGGADVFPTWSPDGNRLVFYSDRDGNQEIYILNADGGTNLINLTVNVAEDAWPDWSPVE